MKWLITGGTGQLGTALRKEFETQSINFISLSKSQLEISQDHSISAITSYSPDVIINCAAWTNVDGAEKDKHGAFLVNAVGARNVAIAAKELHAKLIHISTDYVFSGCSSAPWRTEDLREPKSIYGESKLAGENAILEIYPEKSYVLRTAWLYSPWRRNFAKTMLKLALSNKEVEVVSDQVGQPTSALDLSKQIVSISKANLPPGVYHGTNSGEASWFEFACEIFKLAEIGRAHV